MEVLASEYSSFAGKAAAHLGAQGAFVGFENRGLGHRLGGLRAGIVGDVNGKEGKVAEPLFALFQGKCCGTGQAQ